MENVLTRKEASPMKSGTSEDQTVAPYERFEEIAEIRCFDPAFLTSFAPWTSSEGNGLF